MEELILYEDKDIIVVKKPFGVGSQQDKSGDLDLYTMVKNYIELKEGASQEIGLIHRLDRPVSGVMVFGKNKKSSASLSSQLQEGGFNKEYMAVACGCLEGEGRLVDWIFKNQRLNISKIVNKNSPSAKEAILDYKAIKNIENEGKAYTLVQIKLLTGRHHQIRVQMANLGYALWGDTKYNKEITRKRGFNNIGLCAYRLSFKHPKTNKPMEFEIKEDNQPFDLFN